MMKQVKPITKELLKRCAEDFDKNPSYRALACAASKSELADISYYDTAARKLDMTFSIDLCDSKVTWQKASGRCWILSLIHI